MAGERPFWDWVDQLVETSEIVIDRPKNTPHPRFPEMIYPLDYGYLRGTTSGDGGGVDVWIGSLPSKRADALVMTIDLLKKDAEIKILLGCTEREKQTIVSFLNGHSMKAQLVRRENDTIGWLKTRQSIRRFHPDAVSEATLARILEAATWAPSAHNRQPWRFAVLSGAGVKQSLGDAMAAQFYRDLLAHGTSLAEADSQVNRSRKRIQTAPLVIVLCYSPTVMDSYPDGARQRGEYLMGVQSVAMAGENLLLAAHSEGLGGVWVCAPLFTAEVVREVLGLPGDWEPQGMILLGYPERLPEPRPRRSWREVSRLY